MKAINLPSSGMSAMMRHNLTSFSSSPILKNSCVTALFAANSSVSPTLTWTWFSFKYLDAICCTAFGQVAVKRRVCLSLGVAPKIFAISGSKPMSNIRSASSRTKNCTSFKLTAPISIKSWSRPGVAMRTCGLSLQAFACGPLGTPPKTASEVILAKLANFWHSASICEASSRVGARTRAKGLAVWPFESSKPALAMALKAGRRKPMVFPLPVLATATRSSP
mmetsp:Transcript_7686/g.17204  ORF Transcript_7686/g.17204 Transcript_7686/m.17204 type:complete len:222 (+) Transcript_7686:579-1244(+)